MARKIQINSLYGAIGNQYFRYYKLANAEAITLSGQVAIRWIESKMNIYLNKLLKTQDVVFPSGYITRVKTGCQHQIHPAKPVHNPLTVRRIDCFYWRETARESVLFFALLYTLPKAYCLNAPEGTSHDP